MIDTDIIIPTYNNSTYTAQCLASIYQNSQNFRIIWIDNGSEIEEQEKVLNMLRGVPSHIIKNKENLGFIKAVNQGMNIASSKYVVILNNDTLVTKDWLIKLRKHFIEDPLTGLVGPLTSTDGSWQGVNRLRSDLRFKDEFSNIPQYDNDKTTPNKYSQLLESLFMGEHIMIKGMIAFFCVMTKKEIINEIGFLSEEYGTGFCDDDDYCYRIKQNGYRIYIAKDTFVYHFHRSTFSMIYSDEEINQMIKENKTKFKRKWGEERMPFYKNG
jgi:GT2 family glycosyltransferase